MSDGKTGRYAISKNKLFGKMDIESLLEKITEEGEAAYKIKKLESKGFFGKIEAYFLKKYYEKFFGYDLDG